MISSSKFSYILFALILSQFIEGIFPSHVYAASISVIETSQSPKYNSSKIEDNLYSSSFTQPDTFNHPPELFIEEQSKSVDAIKNSNSKLYTDIYTQGKDFVQNNKENFLLQDTLVFLSQTQDLFKETDLAIHNFSQEIIISMGLKNLNQQDLLLVQQEIKANKQNSHAKSYSSYENSYSQQIQTARLEEMELRVSPEKYTFSDGNLMKAIFDIRNLFYILGVVIVIFLIKKVMKFMLLKDQYDSQHRS